MKHDPDLIRHILEHVAGRTVNDPPVPIPAPDSHPPAGVDQHVALLIEHKLLAGRAGKKGESHAVHALTSDGRRLLRALRDKGVRDKIKQVGTHLGEDVTIHVILDIAKAFLLGL